MGKDGRERETEREGEGQIKWVSVKVEQREDQAKETEGEE